jgi:hypothetical protein
MTSLSGVSWEEADAAKEPGLYGDVPVSYIGLKEYIVNKRASGRQKDLADIEALGELSKAPQKNRDGQGAGETVT